MAGPLSLSNDHSKQKHCAGPAKSSSWCDPLLHSELIDAESGVPLSSFLLSAFFVGVLLKLPMSLSRSAYSFRVSCCIYFANKLCALPTVQEALTLRLSASEETVHACISRSSSVSSRARSTPLGVSGHCGKPGVMIASKMRTVSRAQLIGPRSVVSACEAKQSSCPDNPRRRTQISVGRCREVRCADAVFVRVSKLFYPTTENSFHSENLTSVA